MTMTTRKIYFYSLLLLVVVYSNAYAKRNFEIVLDYCNCTFNQIYFQQCLCHIDKAPPPPKGFIDIQCHHQLNEVYLSLDVFLVRKNNEQFTLFNSTDIDGCSLLDSNANSAQTLIKILKDSFLKGGKFPEKCPIDKDFHFVFNEFTIDAEQFPPYVPEARFGLHAKFNEGKKFLLLLEAYGDVVQKSRNRWG